MSGDTRKTSRPGAALDGGINRAWGRRTQNGECRPGKRFQPELRHPGGHACRTIVAATWNERANRSCKDRTRTDGTGSPEPMDHVESLVDMAWTPQVLCSKPRLSQLRDQILVSPDWRSKS